MSDTNVTVFRFSVCFQQKLLIFFVFIYLLALHLYLAGNSGRLTWVRLQPPQEQRYPFLTVRAVFLCVQRNVWLPMLGMFNARTDVNTRVCTQGLYGHRKRLCTES